MEFYRTEGKVGSMTYRVEGTAHGETFAESGFETSEEAEAYASSVIDGDTDATIEVRKEGS